MALQYNVRATAGAAGSRSCALVERSKIARMRMFAAAAVLFLCAAANVFAQSPAPPPERQWSFGVSVNTYFLPEESNVAQPVVTADRGRLHLETRYNYEALHTGSVWVGVNVSGGRKVEWEITPMVGGVMGEADGVAPGYRGSLTWRELEFYSEGEYVIDTGSSEDSFLYNWSELSWVPAEWFRFGLVTQRTRAYQTDRDIQRGILVGGTYKRLTATLYVFNPDDSKPVWVLGLGFGF
jgi:hypothetical protein